MLQLLGDLEKKDFLLENSEYCLVVEFHSGYSQLILCFQTNKKKPVWFSGSQYFVDYFD